MVEERLIGSTLCSLTVKVHLNEPLTFLHGGG